MSHGYFISRKFIKLSATLIFGAILCLLICNPEQVDAHTAGKMQLSAAPAGPYKITVWTSPDPAEVGELHVAIAVVLAEDASPVLDGDVVVQLTSSGGDQQLIQPATTESSDNKFLYEAIFEPTVPGHYEVEIQVSDSDSATGNASFELEIGDTSSSNLLYLIPAGLGLAAVLLLVLAFRGRRSAPQ